MARIGLIVHLDRESAAEHARELAEWLVGEGHDVVAPADDIEAAELAAVTQVGDDAFAAELDLVVTLGGDGSILRAIELIGAAEVPLLGVDHGQLGYLTEIRPEAAHDSVTRVLAGDYEIERRMLLEVTIDTADGESPTRVLALNEAVVERAADANTIRVGVDIDGDFFTSYAVDGLIVATPTGSTAYAFSARGPIIEPDHRAVLLTPVSPHMLFDRSLVLGPETHVRLRVDGHRTATVSVDGRRIAAVGDGASVTCRAAVQSAHLVTFGSRGFHRVLKEKFGLNDR